MDGNTDRSTGLGSAEPSSPADHPERLRNRARDLVAAALEALEGCNKQEAQEARRLLFHAIKEIVAEG